MVNKVILVGRIGKDPEKHQLESGIVVNFSLATNEKWKDKQGEKQESVEWHNCKAFGSLADIINTHVKQGDLIYVEGKVKTRSYEQDGVKKYSSDIVCYTMQMLGGVKPDQDNEGNTF